MSLIISNFPGNDSETRPPRRSSIIDVNELTPITQALSGASGFSGSYGRSGYSGLSGWSGTGLSGFSGFRGAFGRSGFSGMSGFSGTYSGYSGYTGISGFSGSSGGGGSSPSNRVVVAQSGGDFTSIQSAIDSITTATSSNPFVILIYPGVYNETLTCKDFVHLLGFGSVEYSTSSVVVQGTNNVITTANCNITGIRFNLNPGGSGTIKLVNGAGTGTTFRCTFNNCYFVITGNFGANLTKFCENNGTSDVFFTHSSLYFRPTSSVGCICFDSASGTNNLVDFYMNHFLPTTAGTMIWWRKQTSSAIDEIHVVYFRESSSSSNLVMFKNESTQNIQVNGIFSFESAAFGGTYVETTSTGLVLMNNGDLSRNCVKATTNYSILDADNRVLIDATGGAVTVTLLSAASRMGREFTIKDWKGQSVTNNITVSAVSGEFIDGGSSYVIASPYGSVSLVSDGTNWSVI